MSKGVGAGNSRQPRRKVWAPHPHLKTALWYYCRKKTPCGYFYDALHKNGLSLFFPIFLQYKRELVREFSERIVPQLANGRLKTITDSVFTIDEIQLAHKRMESNENIGKIIIQIRPDDTNTEETKSEL